MKRNGHPTKRRLLYLVLIGAPLVICAALLCRVGKPAPPPPRVVRDHNDVPSSRFAYLNQRIHIFRSQPTLWLSREQAAEDLDELEWLLIHRFSYYTLRSFDCREVLDTLRAGLGSGIDRENFGLQLRKLIALFGDSHSEVGPSPAAFSTRFLPLSAVPIADRVAAVETDRSAFLAEGFPFIRCIDGLPVARWLEQAAVAIPRGSPQFVRHTACRMLDQVQYLREELGLTPADTVELVLESADQAEHRTVVRPLWDKHVPYRPFPFTESRLLPGDIGYLRIASMSRDDRHLQQLVDWMERFRTTSGLVIDVRGNRGGNRVILRTLLPFFLAPEGPPAVINVAACRLGHSPEIPENRWLFPLTHSWTPAERHAIENVLADFQPEVDLPKAEFGDWRFFVVSPSENPRVYYYDRPVVVLMDGYCHSATDIFLGAFQNRPVVTLLGTPSGGGSGAAVTVILRHGYNRVRLSSMMSFRPDGRLYEGRGIQPDIRMDWSLTDLIGQTDSMLDRAIQILKQSGITPRE